MARILVLFLSVLFVLTLTWGASRAGTIDSKSIPTAVPKGIKNNPGATLRISKKGYEYLVKSMGEVLDKILANFKADQINIDLDDYGKLTLNDFEIYEYQGPVYIGTLGKNEINLKIKNIKKVAMRAKIDATIIGLTLTGPIGATLYGVNADITATLGADDNSLPVVGIKDCDITASRMQMDLDKLEGTGAGLAKTFKSTIEKMGKKELGKILCDGAKKGVEEGLNSQFKELAGNASLSNDKQRRNPRSDEAKSAFSDAGIDEPKEIFDVNMEKYKIDYRFASDKQPEVTKDYIQTMHRGEISYKGEGGTPFYAVELQSPKGDDKHFYSQLSDYIWNSLLFSLHQQKDLDVNLKQKGFEGSHSPSKMPYCLVTGGKMDLDMKGRGEIKKFDGSKVSTSGETNLQGNVDLEFRKTGIVGEMGVKKFNWDTSKSDSDTTKKMENAMKFVVKEFVDELLVRGVPTDITQYISFQKSEINLKQDHTLGLETDIELNKDKVAEVIKLAILAKLSNT